MNRKQNSLMRFSRTERLAQLSEQEIVIERKKKEIQAKLEAKKKKQTEEEALKKFESSEEIKCNKPEFSKKSFWRGNDCQKSNSKEKPVVEFVKESLTNSFSNDGSFLDQFKKLSQKGMPATNTTVQTEVTKEKVEKIKVLDEMTSKDETQRRGKTTGLNDMLMNDYCQSFRIGKHLDSKVKYLIPPPGVVQLLPQPNCVSVMPSPVSSPCSSTNSVLPAHFQGEVEKRIQQLNSNNTSSLQIPAVQQFSTDFNLTKKNNAESCEFDYSPVSDLSTVQLPLPVTPQNIPPPPRQVQGAPLLELPKLRTESISMTLKINPAKKLESIPNPLEVIQPPSPPSKRNQFGITGIKGSLKDSFLNTTQIIQNVTSHDRESLKISSAFNHNNQEENEDLLGEKYHHWAELVAQYGDDFEESLRNRNQNDPNIGFLLNENANEYLSFRKLVLKYRSRLRSSDEDLSKKNPETSKERSLEENISRCSDDYEFKDSMSSDSTTSLEQQHKSHSKLDDIHENNLNKKELDSTEVGYFSTSKNKFFEKETSNQNLKGETFMQISEHLKTDDRRKRKRKSRWGDAAPTTSTPQVTTNLNQPTGKLLTTKSTLLSQLTRSDPGLIQYAKQTFGSINLSEEDWKKAEDHYKINLLYQDMVKKRAEVEKLEKQGKFKYEYDSDEDTEGGTWEHKLRQQEMQATQLWAEELTRQAAGKHHIGDFLPPEELERFMEKYNAVKEGREPDLSDYKEYKLKEDNVGYRLLQKMGWNEGQGLGQDGSGITNPVNKATTRHENQGLGIERPDGLEAGDDEYDAYRKRMMLAYRFRPNPLNNPRRPYY